MSKKTEKEKSFSPADDVEAILDDAEQETDDAEQETDDALPYLWVGKGSLCLPNERQFTRDNNCLTDSDVVFLKGLKDWTGQGAANLFEAFLKAKKIKRKEAE